MRISKDSCLGIVQRLLYEYPLYDYSDNAGNINIAVIGYNEFTSKFVDNAIEVLQINGINLNICFFCSNIKDELDYLSNRTALKNFITVNNDKVNDSWGNISFKFYDATDKKINKNILINSDDVTYNYFLIDTDNFLRNKEISEEIKIFTESSEIKPFIVYISDKQTVEKDIISINEEYTIENHNDYKTLKAMAMNCHLVWNSSENLNIQKLRNQFRSKYNFENSFSNVLSIKYKLYSLGIIWNNNSNFYNLADEYYKSIINEKSSVDDLVRYEHRRWCIYMITNGWKPQEDLSKCVFGIKDKNQKLHPCIVKSDAKLYLNDSIWKQNNYLMWDKASNEDLEKLDELDRMSVLLYRELKKQSDVILNNHLYPSEEIYIIRELIKDYPNTILPFERLVNTIKGIINKEISYTIIYESNKANFKKTLYVLPDKIEKIIKRHLENIDTLFFPIFESEKHLNYKSLDFKLIRSIPFILTYHNNIKIGIPMKISKFDIGNDERFSNIASVIKLNPSRVTYFIDSTHVDNDILTRNINYIIKAFDARNLQTTINLLFLKKSSQKPYNIISEEIKLNKRINSIKTIVYTTIQELKEQLSPIFTKRFFTALEENDSSTYGLLAGMGLYNDFPSFMFDSKKFKFYECNSCNYFKYIQLKCHLQVSDIVDLNNASENIDLPDLQNDYMYFWNFYRGKKNENKEKHWKNTCTILKNYCNTNDNLLSFNLRNSKETTENKFKDLNFIIPQMCYLAVKKIIDSLKNYQLLGENSKIEFYNISSCLVVLNCDVSTKVKFEELFSNPYYLCNHKDIYIFEENSHVYINFDSLIVTDLDINYLNKNAISINDKNKIIDNLNAFASKGYLINLKLSNEKYSFCFSSSSIKKLLTNEGFLLETYIYYKIIESNYFDEVCNGTIITWKNQISNEFDLILVKDFKMIIVEIKARRELNQDFYHKLSNLSKQIGINSKSVLIADTFENDYYENPANETQRKRGNQYGIITINKKNDIDNIVNILKTII